MEYEESDYWVYEFAKIWNCDQERSNHIVHEFFKSPHFKDGIPPVPGALEALQRLGQLSDLVVVTSRQHVIQDVTLEWIDRHYAGLFQDVYFGNHWALQVGGRAATRGTSALGEIGGRSMLLARRCGQPHSLLWRNVALMHACAMRARPLHQLTAG